MNEDINRKYYESLAPGRLDYWNKMAAPRMRAKVILNWLRNITFHSLVDLGCGNGVQLEEIRNNFPDVDLCGVDYSTQQIQQNQAAHPQFKWVLSDLDQDHSLPDSLVGKYDVALCVETIEHLDHPELLLKHARTLTRPQAGYLILTTQSGRVWETERRVGHKRHFSKTDLEALLTSAGWNPIKIWNAGFPFHDFSKWGANLDPDITMKRFGREKYGPIENAVCGILRAAFHFNSPSVGAQIFAVARNE